MKILSLIAAVLMVSPIMTTSINETSINETLSMYPTCAIDCTPFKCCEYKKNQPRCIGCYSNKCCKWQRK